MWERRGLPSPVGSLEGRDSILTIHELSRNLNIEKGSDGIFSKSHVNWLVTRAINNLSSKPDSLFMTEFYTCQSPTADNYRVAFEIMQKLLIKIANLGKDKNVPVVFVLAPSIVQANDKHWKVFMEKNSLAKKNFIRSSPNDRLMQFAKDNNILMLDLLPLLLRKGKRM